MSKIFISHSTKDADLATRLMDLLQNQFNLTRSNFFLTSDEELEEGNNWIEEIRKGVEDANIILPLITPNFLDSQFCLCELGAAWINQKALVPVIVPPLDYHALDGTPYRTWSQAITLNSVKDLQRLAQAIIKKGVGEVNIVRFTTRAETFHDEVLRPFISHMEQRERVTLETVLFLREELNATKEAYVEVEAELSKLKIENEEIRKLKNASEVKEYDFSKMSEWDTFLNSVEKVKDQLKPLSHIAISILYHDRKGSSDGFIGEQDDRAKLTVLENEGVIKWDDGWVPDYDHSAIFRANEALDELSIIIRNYEDYNLFLERFEEEFKDVRFSLIYSPFWEEVLDQRIQHSAS